MNAMHNADTNTPSAAQQFDAAEYVVRVLDSGVVIYEECDIIVLDI